MQYILKTPEKFPLISQTMQQKLKINRGKYKYSAKVADFATTKKEANLSGSLKTLKRDLDNGTTK